MCKYNTDYLHEKAADGIGKRLQEWIALPKQRPPREYRDVGGIAVSGKYYFFLRKQVQGKKPFSGNKKFSFAKCGF